MPPRPYSLRERWRYLSSILVRRDTGEDLPFYHYNTSEKIHYALESLRMRLAPRHHLIAGPYAGEFGLELMLWQAFVRARKPAYESVQVLTYPGRDYLYEGCTVHAHEIPLQNAGYGYGLLDPRRGRAMADDLAARLGLTDYDVFLPAHVCTRYHRGLIWRMDFRLFQEEPLPQGPWDVAFHFRAVAPKGPDIDKNYSPGNAARLVDLCLQAGLRVACIGHPDYAICPEGAGDYRRTDLRESIRVMNSAHLIAGENSGPMHLANLCGKPTLLWANDPWRINYSLRWNPFRVPQFVAADHTSQPDPQTVFASLQNALAELRARTRGFTQPCYTLPAQPIALA